MEHIELIVKCEFLVLLNVPYCENADAHFSQHIPLLRDAIRLAGVVDESSQVPLISRVNHLMVIEFHEVSAC